MFQEGKATWTTGSINVGLNALALSKAGLEPISSCHQNTRGQAYLNLRTETKKAKSPKFWEICAMLRVPEAITTLKLDHSGRLKK